MADRRTLLEPLLDNKLPDYVDSARLFAGSAGESPSKYSRSPGMWNAAFKELGLDAAYVPFDVRSENLVSFINTVREVPGFIGGNVTVPHKLAIMELLDEIDPIARQIGAVNTYARQEDGRLIGYNSDADGLLGSMLRTMPGKSAPFIESLSGMRALIVGAGGAGRAASFAIAGQLGGGSLLITNRTLGTAEELAQQVNAAHGNAKAVSQDEAFALLPEIDLVVNTSTIGQSGIRHLADGKATFLQPYSSLAPADPVIVDEREDVAGLYNEFLVLSKESIDENNAAAERNLATCKPGAAFVDAVYSPDETTMLRQAREAGFKTLNGKGMLIMQAAESFIKRMTRRYLIEAGHDPDSLYDRVVTTMASAFDAQG